MDYKKLSDLCDVVSGGTPARSRIECWENGTIPWVKISDLSSKYIKGTEEKITETGLKESSAKLLPRGTILFSIFATLGATGILDIDASTNQAIAGLTVRDSRTIDPEYLYYYLLSKKTYVNNIGRGVAQNNINLSILKSLEVPVPTVDEQRSIITILNKNDAIITGKRKVLKALNELVKARFVEMFGDPTYNPKGYKIKKLSQLGELNRGVSKARPRNSPELLGGPYPLVQTGEVTASELYINTYENTYSEKGLAQSRMWPKGTLCITIAANIAQTAILNIDACFPDSVVGFIPGKEVTQIYMHYWFTFFQKILEEQAPQVAQKNINLKILNDLDVMVPERTLQEQFEKLVNQTDKSKLLEVRQAGFIAKNRPTNISFCR